MLFDGLHVPVITKNISLAFYELLDLLNFQSFFVKRWNLCLFDRKILNAIIDSFSMVPVGQNLYIDTFSSEISIGKLANSNTVSIIFLCLIICSSYSNVIFFNPHLHQERPSTIIIFIASIRYSNPNESNLFCF